MANSLTHALPFAIKNARFTLPMSFRTAAGTPTDPTTPDTEFSADGGASFADCAEEITTGGGNGMGYLTLTGAETNNNTLLIAGKSANCVETPVIIYPRVLPILSSGTLSAGSAGGGTLGTILPYDIVGCFVRTTGGTGGGGTGGANNQARIVATYVTTTGAFTVTPNWETTPDATTTYDVLLPTGSTFGALKAINPGTGTGQLSVTSGQVTASSVTAIATNGISAASLAASATAKIATATWQDATAGDFTTASSIGKALYTGNFVPGAAGGLFIAGTNAATTVNITGNLSGSVGSVTGLTASNLDTPISSRMATFTLPTNFSSLAITAGGAVTAGTVSDKTGYALSASQAFDNTGTWTGNIVGTLSTLTTYTGNTPQTGDSFARIGAAGAGLTVLATAANLATANTALVKIQAADYDTVSVTGDILTLSNGATQTVTAAGRVTA